MKTRILSMMLALLMAVGSFGIFCSVPGVVSAADAVEAGGTGSAIAEGETETTEDPYVSIVASALRTNYASAQDKLDSDQNMVLSAKHGVYELYVNQYTGEIGIKDTTTGQILLSNPYKIEETDSLKVSDSTRAQLLSQIYLEFFQNGVRKEFYSYTEAAARGQIFVKNIKNGVRVEYTLGREDANYLTPGSITEARMVSMILSVWHPELAAYDENEETKFPAESGKSYYDKDVILLNSVTSDIEKYYAVKQFLTLYDLIDPFKKILKNGVWDYEMDEDARQKYAEQFAAYKGTTLYEREMAVYRISDTATARDKRMLENYIKTYCPNYTQEEMDKDHEETKYVSDELDPPLFKLALEYTLTAEGLSIRLPANGIRFDYSLYTLGRVIPLQYFGAGDMSQDGYLFYPDGSGALLYYEDLAKKNTGTVTGKVYGPDYAYHQITGQHQEAIRVPVFGAINVVPDTQPVYDENGVLTGYETLETKTTSGYLAILEEGDSMAQITAAWGGSQHPFASAYTTFEPRPKDTYDLSGDASSGSDTTWTVESSRKYTGSYKMRIYMLSDRYADSNGQCFAPSYVGMANAYRHYLTDVAGILTALTLTDTENVPLYIESFGTVPDVQRFFSIPIEVNVPLTTFDNVQQMYKDLSTNGIVNVNFKLTGFANGGMYYTYPNRLNWMGEVGGDAGFSSLLSDAREKDYGIYPDFDFMYVKNRELFDGVDLKYAAARTIDNRYSNRRVYNATHQEFVSFFEICVTPSMIEEYYVNFAQKYMGFDPIGISVASLGSDLNSDFGDKAPTNRDEAKKIISDVFKQLHEDYNGSVMTSGGNIYALKYTEHLLGAALDSSRFASASRSVPFVGMVLHGYVNFAGSAINMAGNVNYQVLKAIENGAGVYFTLSYDNTGLLKEYEDLSQYYSVNYEIWAGEFDKDGNLIKRGELFEVYDRVNSAIGKLQNKLIINHQFLIGERDALADEIAADESAIKALLTEAEAVAVSQEMKAAIQQYRADFEAGDRKAFSFDTVPEGEEDAVAVLQKTIALLPTNSEATAGDAYVSTKYTLDNGLLVMVEYEGGTSFILNYNIYAVKVVLNGQTYTIAPYEYATIHK